MMRIAAVMAGLALGLGAASVALGQERLALPGSRFSLELPEGFTVAEEFSGYTNPEIPMEIAIGSFPEGREDQSWRDASPVFEDLEAAKAFFAEPGLVLTERETITTDEGRELLVVRGTLTKEGLPPLKRWLVLVGPEAAAPISVERVGDRLDDAAVRTILQSLEVGPEISEAEQLAALPFAIEPVEPFTWLTIRGGKLVALTPSPFETMDPINPIVILKWERPPAPITAAQASELMLHDGADLAKAVIEEKVAVPFAGGDGFRISGSFVRGGIASRFVQYNAVVRGWSVAILGTSAAEFSELMAPIIEAMAASVKPQ